MKIRYPIICSALLAFANSASAQKIPTLKPIRHISLAIPEPSDICLSADGNHFYIVSDNGLLFETDLQGSVTRKSNYAGMDNEAVFANAKHVYAVEEATRKVKVFDPATLEVVKTKTLEYSGGRNKGYEAMTFNAAKNRFVVLTEKNPVYLFELDTDLNVINEIDLGKIALDISAATYHDNHLWLLSDEDSLVIQLDPNTYAVQARWKLPIINPEGMAFDPQGNLVIVSDDLRRLYFFGNPEQQ